MKKKNFENNSLDEVANYLGMVQQNERAFRKLLMVHGRALGGDYSFDTDMSSVYDTLAQTTAENPELFRSMVQDAVQEGLDINDPEFQNKAGKVMTKLLAKYRA